MQKYYYKVYLFRNGRKSIDYSEYLLSPIFYEEKLDEALDTGEIILDCMPISTKKSFPPKTKFRIERYTTSDFSNKLDENDIIDMVVEHDDVEEYAGCSDICCHRLHLIEPSVIAQGMHVDNISLTYELNDVNLNYKTVVDTTDTLKDNELVIKNWEPSSIVYENFSQKFVEASGSYYKSNSYAFRWEEVSSFSQILKYLDASLPRTISFNIPLLKCYHYTTSGQLEYLFDCPVKVEVTETLKENGIAVSSRKLDDSEIENNYYNPASVQKRNDNVMYNDGIYVGLRSYEDESFTSNSRVNGRYYITLFNNERKMPAIIDLSIPLNGNREVSFMTGTLSQSLLSKGCTLHYKIDIVPQPKEENSMVSIYKKRAVIGEEYSYWYEYLFAFVGAQLQKHKNVKITTEEQENVILSDLVVSGEVICRDNSTVSEGGPLIAKGVNYSAYDLLRKALLTTDTHVIDNDSTSIDEYSKDENGRDILTGIQYPIIVNSSWRNRLKTTKINETIFEGKNLWEVLLQIGYYLHAIPFLKFADDGTDRFVLSFRQLGEKTVRDDANTKITVFNSLAIHDYFAQYDSYVTNLFSPQTLIEEWAPIKTSDSSMLVSNNTAEIQLAYPITELLEFDISYNGGCGGTAGTKSALNYVFEKSIYQILSNDNPNKVFPCKGTSLYFELTTNKIQGLTFVPPAQPTFLGSEQFPMALKKIVALIWQKENGENIDVSNLKFNDLMFHIKYRTQDNLRVSQVRPDLQRFMKNSSYEKYPHHEQYYGQQDKIVDSERFSENLFGKLIRVGNGIYQRQEYCPGKTKERTAGDLILLNGEPYYATEVENEYYPDAIFQKVTYSKNFNQLANIVTIPSEPRFYEVSERSKIRREVRIMDFFQISSQKPAKAYNPRFLANNIWKTFFRAKVFKDEVEFPEPNFAWIRFMVDQKRVHQSSSTTIALDKMFPSSDLVRTYDENEILTNVEPKSADDHTDTIVPLLSFPLHNGIIYEWDMADNFKSGDFVDTFEYGEVPNGTADNAYLSQQSYRYCDVMGRADLFKFKLFRKIGLTMEESKALPKPIFEVEDSKLFAHVKGNDKTAIALDKDCREELSFNYQINLLYIGSSDKDDFVTFPNLFGIKDSRLRMQFQSEEKSLFDENLNLSGANIIADDVQYTFNETDYGLEIRIIRPESLTDEMLAEVKSIILYDGEDNKQKTAYIVKNIANLSCDEKLNSWYIYPTFTDDVIQNNSGGNTNIPYDPFAS